MLLLRKASRIIPYVHVNTGAVFPTDLRDYGLSEERLQNVFIQVLEGREPEWRLKGIPEIQFYRQLHPFLKKWPVSYRTSKQAIGKFYCAIDPNLKARGFQADNVYRFIERISHDAQSPNEVMSYGNRESLIKAMHTEARACTDQMETLNTECVQLKEKLEKSQKHLSCARKALQDITNEKFELQKQCKEAKTKAFNLRHKYAELEDNFAQMEEDNIELSSAISDLRVELESLPDESMCESNTNGDFSLQTKNGRRYSPAIRKLYYALLSQQIPSARIADVVRTVIKCFYPADDVSKLQLPQRSCADYMRKCELTMVSNAHKASALSKSAAEGKGFRLNTDGTTKQQKKIGAVGINDVVISVNELPDGTAVSAIEDVSKELEKLREIARALRFPNADQILFTSSTSDCAATQKRLNKLIDDYREKDEQRFGAATLETVAIVESFCSMHLGINLQKAFLTGIISEDSVTDSSRKYHPVDKFVHEFCKLFGNPEYGSGACAFPDFLKLMTDDSSICAETQQYFESCLRVHLRRQVRSRYFVSASNAAWIVFLAEAAVEFLRYTGKESGNKLEIEVYMKLTSVDEMAKLRVDAIMYYHIYADLVMLSKSNELAKSVMDMNNHYLELLCFLSDVQKSPELVMDKNYEVFRSEKRLYGSSSKVNHRRHKNVDKIYDKVFEETGNDSASNDCFWSYKNEGEGHSVCGETLTWWTILEP